MTRKATGDLHAVDQRLADYSRLTRTAVNDFLAAGQPADYLYDLVREYPRRAGKGLRPALLLAACQAFGGSVADGLRPAVALEMLHNAFLIHDDVEDASASRRGARTLHMAHGVPLAVNAGDALAALSLEPLLDGNGLGSRLTRRLIEEFSTMVRTTTEGQALELGWRRHNVIDLRPTDYLGMAVKKTCWYTTVSPLRLGSLVGCRGVAPLDALTRFGMYLGVAFQIRDDLLSTAIGANTNGKEMLGDIHEGKRTLMLIHLLENVDGGDRRWLVGYLASPQSSRAPTDAESVLELMEAYGSLEFARDYAHAMAEAACQLFDTTFAGAVGAASVKFIRDLIPYVLARSA